MPLFMDIHGHIEEIIVDSVAHAHILDLKLQEKYGMTNLRYWFDDTAGKVVCSIEAPNTDQVIAGHLDA